MQTFILHTTSTIDAETFEQAEEQARTILDEMEQKDWMLIEGSLGLCREKEPNEQKIFGSTGILRNQAAQAVRETLI